ncbi:hypothetical protein F5Y16DRAFT_359733 [Xylariaceae sp. FL0255]|nr:hypothetical protein F5Y16DRAFT_359733 [Xylariaceae sp. FL0255]
MYDAMGFRFFDLPAELRLDILSRLLLSKYGIILHNHTLFEPNVVNQVSILNIFLVSVQMYQEASAIFYSQNCFTINAQSHRLPIHLTKPGGFLSEQGQDARRRVHTLALYLTRVGGEFEDILRPAIADMILSGSLRRLKVCLGQPTSHPSRSSGSDVVTRPPFKALLELLGDPDLDNVELLVWKVHWSTFCPFHQEPKVARPSKPLVETVDDLGLATARGGNSEWIELDWQLMLNVLGTGHRIVKIDERDLN